MALKLEDEQLFCLKGEQPSATNEYIFSINFEKTTAFCESGKFAYGLDIRCSLHWDQKSNFSHPMIFIPNTYYAYFVKCSSGP